MPSIPAVRWVRATAFLPLVALAALFTVSAALAPPRGASADPDAPIDQALRSAIGPTQLPGLVAMIADSHGVIYQGAFGERDALQHLPMAPDSIFRIASMTKPVTSVAVMQLVESGRVKLDEPAATYLPELAHLQVLDEFDPATGKARLRPPKSPPTVRQLLTHTSGFVYEFFDPTMHAYAASGAVPSASQGGDAFLNAPLLFDPGTRWEYGISCDWLGRLVERVSGESLEDYFHRHIFSPLGMDDTFFNVPPEKQARVVAVFARRPDGAFFEPPPQPFTPVKFFSGGGGLYSTAADYIKFERMLLDGGKLARARILRSSSVAEMSRNQIGSLNLVALTSMIPQFAKNPVRVPGSLDKFGLGFAINTQAVGGGRSAGSLAWAGIYNTYFWIDPSRKLCGVLMTQLLPFSDDATLSTFDKFERAAYARSAHAAAFRSQQSLF